MIILYIIVFILGLIFGSFFNVLIYRIPLKKSIVFPSSHCPNCNASIKFYDNIPIISYLILGGKCRNCDMMISPIYPIVELITGIMFLFLFIHSGLNIVFFIYLLNFSFLLILSFIDFNHKEINVYALIIPYIITFIYLFLNSNVLPESILFNNAAGFIEGIIGSLIAGLLFFIVRFLGTLILKREAMGEADIYIVILTGLILGYKVFFFSIIFAGITGLIFYAFYSRIKKDPEMPFIPFLSLGCFLALMFKSLILQYLTI